MFRKLSSVAVVPALLILLTAGAVQARPLNEQAPPAGLLTQIWQWAKCGVASVGIKAGGEMDPNGHTTHWPLPQPPRREGIQRGAQGPGEAR
jgi:hypothetical protein